MIRPLVALAVLAGLGMPVLAQEAAPAAPAPADIVVDPAASPTASRQTNMLTGFYATLAVIELCELTIEQPVVDGMAADRIRLERSLAMDTPTGETAYAQVKADVEKTTPDCAEGSADRASVDAVTAIYKAQTAAPAPAAAPAAPVEPAMAPAAPAAQ